MTIINFEEVRMYGRKTVKCAGGCGRRLKRSRKFFQTISPFNKNPDGTVKNRNDIYNELAVWVSNWEKAPEECIHCRTPF